MGNLGSRKKQKEDEITDDVWLKLNDGDHKSPKQKKKKKKKRKKKGKRDSPDGHDDDTSQCDTCSYSQSTLSSRKLSDSTIASAGTVTHQDNYDTKPDPRVGAIIDDQSNGSIGYVTASDTFTPPSPRKGRHSKFSPVIAQDSPRFVRRLLQSEQKQEDKTEELLENLSPRAKFFLSTPESSKSTRAFENRKFSRHSSGSSIDSRTFLGLIDEKVQKTSLARANDNRYITNGSLLVKSRQQENKNNLGHDSRLSNNSLEMSDSTTENLVKTGEKAKLIRYDNGNMSPAERRKYKQNDLSRSDSNNAATNMTFVKYDGEHPNQGVKDNFIDFIITNESESELLLPTVTVETEKEDKKLETGANKGLLRANESQLEIVPPPSPASGVSLLEVDESEITESESCSEKHLSREDELFGDSVCKRLSLLLESEQDSTKLNRSEFHEFTDSQRSSPDIPGVVCEGGHCEKIKVQDNSTYEQTCGKLLGVKYIQISSPDDNKHPDDSPSCEILKNEKLSENKTFENLKCETNYYEMPKVTTDVKTPQGKDNASVLDVMNNNFRMRTKDNNIDVMTRETIQDVHCARACEIRNTDQLFSRESYWKEDEDIEEQMKYENEINEKLIEERIKTLHEILPPQNEANKRNSLLCAINNKHANDPDNYILVTKKTYCVKRGVLVELMDEEKDVITRDVIKSIDGTCDWITTGSEEKYKPDDMFVEQGQRVVCPTFDQDESFTESDISHYSSEPDYVNLEEFERLERKLHEESQSDEEIDFENVLNRSQSQSDSECSDIRPKRESEILCDVISAYKDDDYSEYSDEVSEEEILYIEEPRMQNKPFCSKRVEYSDEFSDDDEILYAEETHNESSISAKVIRTPSKLDQSLQKIFHDKAKELALSAPFNKEPYIEHFDETPTAEVYEQFQAAGYDSPHHKSSEGSRRSLAYTESDLDASEKWEDASNDSMLADDEDDDDEIGQIIFSKPYIEHDSKAEAMFSYNMVKALPDSPIMWEPTVENDDVFQDMPLASSGYHPEDSLDSSDEAFDDARKQMQEIHEQLQSLREQMVTFDNEEEESSLPTSPLDDRISNIPKAETD